MLANSMLLGGTLSPLPTPPLFSFRTRTLSLPSSGRHILPSETAECPRCSPFYLHSLSARRTQLSVSKSSEVAETIEEVSSSAPQKHSVKIPVGDRHSLAVITLGDKKMAQRIDNLVDTEEAKRFYLQEASFNLKLPRRNMIVQFTCNSCGERTQRRINRVAYERGTVFIQCAGCLVNHKLIDNLGLVVEYDLREKLDADLDGTQ